jgi:hypothetical protein
MLFSKMRVNDKKVQKTRAIVYALVFEIEL